MNLDPITDLAILALGTLLFWGAKLIVAAIAKLGDKVDRVEAKVDDHNTATISRLTRVETKVDGLDDRVEHIERIVLKRA